MKKLNMKTVRSVANIIIQGYADRIDIGFMQEINNFLDRKIEEKNKRMCRRMFAIAEKAKFESIETINRITKFAEDRINKVVEERKKKNETSESRA